jgi:hypothetical protein
MLRLAEIVPLMVGTKRRGMEKEYPALKMYPLV